VNRYSSASLTQWVAVVLEAGGISAPHASVASGVLVRTSLRGVDAHGVSRIPLYMQRIAAGEITSNDPQAEWRDGALHVKGEGALGQVVATFAVDQCVQATEKVACAPCVITSCASLSALGLFALQAAEAGRVGFVCQRTPAVMGLSGSPRATIGNNPIAFAAPVRGGTPLVFDMANSVVARGRIQQAARDNAPIPADWAMGGDGQPTTEAAAALMGYLRPMAEHKGIGLAMVVEVLSAGLAGWREHKDPEATASRSATGVDAFVLVINPALICGQEVFEAGAHRWLRHFLNTSGEGARFPGQRQAAMEKERLAVGIPIPAGVVRELREAGRAVGHDFDLIPMGTITSR